MINEREIMAITSSMSSHGGCALHNSIGCTPSYSVKTVAGIVIYRKLLLIDIGLSISNEPRTLSEPGLSDLPRLPL